MLDTVSQNLEKEGVNPESSERRTLSRGLDSSCLLCYEDTQGVAPGNPGSPFNVSTLHPHQANWPFASLKARYFVKLYLAL